MRKIKEEWENQRNLFLFISGSEHGEGRHCYQNLYYYMYMYFFTNPSSFSQENSRKIMVERREFPFGFIRHSRRVHTDHCTFVSKC